MGKWVKNDKRFMLLVFIVLFDVCCLWCGFAILLNFIDESSVFSNFVILCVTRNFQVLCILFTFDSFSHKKPADPNF